MRIRACSTSATASSAIAPPATWSGASAWPSITHASSDPITGSIIVTMLVAPAPIRAAPETSVTYGRAVPTTVIQRTRTITGTCASVCTPRLAGSARLDHGIVQIGSITSQTAAAAIIPPPVRCVGVSVRGRRPARMICTVAAIIVPIARSPAVEIAPSPPSRPTTISTTPANASGIAQSARPGRSSPWRTRW